MAPNRNQDQTRAEIDVSSWPLTEVQDMDDPARRPRLIRRHAREAVVWCYVSDVSDLQHLDNYRTLAVLTERYWICGRYKAYDSLTLKS